MAWEWKIRDGVEPITNGVEERASVEAQGGQGCR